MKINKLLFIPFICIIGCTIINPVRKSPYKTFSTNCTKKPFDLIIVPGVPYVNYQMGLVMKSRIQWSKFLIEKKYAINVMYFGGAVQTPFIESKIMALYAKAMGIPEANIYTEEKAEHSTENIYYSYKLAKEKGFKNIALATDPFQTNNLRRYIKKNKWDITILPIVFDSVFIMDKTEIKIDPFFARVDSASFVPLNKRENFFKRLRGTAGKNIMDKKK
jgi:uncharacterized SAM-binding protein YcdF (DUF218 family)